MKKSLWILGGDGLNLKPNHRKLKIQFCPGVFWTRTETKRKLPVSGDSWIILESWKRFSEAMSNQRSKEQLEIFKTIALELLPGIFVLTKE